MTEEHLIQLVTTQFPEKLETEIRVRLNNAAKTFCHRTYVLRKTFTTPTLAGVTSYALDTDVLRVDEVVVDGNVISRLLQSVENYVNRGINYYVSGGRLEIGVVGDGVWSALDAGYTITMRCRAMPADLSEFVAFYDSAGNLITDAGGSDVYVVGDTQTESMGVPAEFHEAVVHKVLSDLFLSEPSISARERVALSREYKQRWEEAIRDGRRHADRDYTGGFNAVPHTY